MSLVSQIESSVSGAATNFGNNLGTQAKSFLDSLNPLNNTGSVVTNMPDLPPIFTADNSSIINSNYLLHLSGQDENNDEIDIMASLPEHFSFHLAADWQPLLHNPSLTGFLGTVIKDATVLGAILGKGLGIADYSQASTMQIYNSTTPLDLSFPFVFNAITNPTTEVMQPIQQLMSLVSPSLAFNNAVLKIPGPNIFDQIYGKGYKISLRIGNALAFPNVIVTGVSPMFDCMMHSSGDMISAQVDVSIRTTTILTKQDIQSLFLNLAAPGAAPGTQASRQGNTAYSAPQNPQEYKE